MAQLTVNSTLLPYPQTYSETKLRNVAEYVGMNGIIKMDKRIGAPAYTYNIAIKWLELTPEEADTVEAVFDYLATHANAPFVGPRGEARTVRLQARASGLSMTPFTVAGGERRFECDMVLEGN